jgi:hypothetical protein
MSLGVNVDRTCNDRYQLMSCLLPNLLVTNMIMRAEILKGKIIIHIRKLRSPDIVHGKIG